MSLMYHRIHCNARPVPERKAGEDEKTWQARLERYRREDRRIAVAGVGMPNFAFGYAYYAGAIGNAHDRPMRKMEDGDLTGEVHYRRYAGGFFSVAEE